MNSFAAPIDDEREIDESNQRKPNRFYYLFNLLIA